MSTPSPILGTTYQSVLGAVINSLRSKNTKQITQGDIAKEIGITVSTWSRIERGESALTLEQLLSVALYLELPLSKLFQSVEEQIELLRVQGVKVAISKDALIQNNALKLSNSQLISMGLLAGPVGIFGLAAYGAYLALLKPSTTK